MAVKLLTDLSVKAARVRRGSRKNLDIWDLQAWHGPSGAALGLQTIQAHQQIPRLTWHLLTNRWTVPAHELKRRAR
jgi:hypothetical protein